VYRSIALVALVASGLAVAVAPALAGKSGPANRTDPPCNISPSPAAVGQGYVVSVSGIPIGTPVNLWVTDPSGSTTGNPLGSTPDGTFNLEESSSVAGTWTYAFSGPTKNRTTVYATCSVKAY
jgi:hypothetical protein